MAKQQRLFDHYNPMEKRLGKAFFDGLPTESGIYKMYSGDEKLLYVGKAKNHRTRLFTYRRAKMETTSSKIIRLIRMTHQIEMPMEYELSVENIDMNQILELISFFLIGENPKLIDWLVAKCEEENMLESFAGLMILDDLDAMKWFL